MRVVSADVDGAMSARPIETTRAISLRKLRMKSSENGIVTANVLVRAMDAARRSVPEIRSSQCPSRCAGQLRPRRAPLERAHVDGKSPELPVQEIEAQRARDGTERQLAPWNRVFIEQPHLEAFRPGPEVEIEQPRAEHDVDLVDLRQADHGVELPHLHPRARLLGGFAGRAGDDRLAVLEKARGQRPQAVARIDRPPAQEHPALPIRQTADDDLRILIVDRAAARAYPPRKRVALRNPLLERGGAAVAAEFHGPPGGLMKCSR